jgi:hypothetical protein
MRRNQSWIFLVNINDKGDVYYEKWNGAGINQIAKTRN